MDSMPRSKDRSRGELEKLRELTFKEKLWYIWNYYNYFIIGGIVAIAIIASLLRTCVFTPDTALFIAWENPYIEQEQLDAFKDSFNERLFEPDANKVVDASFFYSVSDDPMVTFEHGERIVAMLAAGMIDIFIVDEIALREFSVLEFIMPLDGMLEDIREQAPLVHEQLLAEAAHALYGYEEGSISEQFVGIRVTDCPLFKELSINVREDAYICVAISSKNYYYVAHAIMEMFK